MWKVNVLKTYSTFWSSFTFALIQLLSFSRDVFFLLSFTGLIDEVVLEVVPVLIKNNNDLIVDVLTVEG